MYIQSRAGYVMFDLMDIKGLKSRGFKGGRRVSKCRTIN